MRRRSSVGGSYQRGHRPVNAHQLSASGSWASHLNFCVPGDPSRHQDLLWAFVRQGFGKYSKVEEITPGSALLLRTCRFWAPFGEAGWSFPTSGNGRYRSDPVSRHNGKTLQQLTSISGSAMGTLSTPLSSSSASGSMLIALKSIVKSRISSSARGGGGGWGSCSSNEVGNFPCAFTFAVALSFCHCS